MRALYIHYPPSISVKSSLAPGPPGAPPSDLAVPSAAVEPEPVASHVDAHLPLLTEAVGRETVDARADQANCNVKLY